MPQLSTCSKRTVSIYEETHKNKNGFGGDHGINNRDTVSK